MMKRTYSEVFGSIYALTARRAPYDEVLAALDAIDQEYPRHRGHALEHRVIVARMYDRPDNEVAAHLDAYLAPELPIERRAETIIEAVGYSPELVRRYVLPLLEEFRQTDHTPEMNILDMAANTRRVYVLGFDPVEMAMHHIEAMFAYQDPYDETMRALDDCEAMEGSEPYLPAIYAMRCSVAEMHDLPDEELIALHDAYIAMDTNLISKASRLLAACTQRPALAHRYLPGLITELEAADHSARPSYGELLELARQRLAAATGEQ